MLAIRYSLITQLVYFNPYCNEQLRNVGSLIKNMQASVILRLSLISVCIIIIFNLHFYLKFCVNHIVITTYYPYAQNILFQHLKVKDLVFAET